MSPMLLCGKAAYHTNFKRRLLLDQFIARLAEITNDRLKLNEPMDRHTTFRIGGSARVFVTPGTEGELAFAIQAAKDEGIPYYIMGRGSNILVSDKGINGAVISTLGLRGAEITGDLIAASAGETLSGLAELCRDSSLSGLEFAYGIPGTLGGAVYMNAGAYGGEVKDLFVSAKALNPDSGEIIELSKEDMGFGYRKSVLQLRNLILLSAVVRLSPGSRQAISEKMNAFKQSRVDKQPLDFPSAGSAFKRPKDNFAGKLIMDSGLSGLSIGGARVSEKHCGFIINTGGASADNVAALIAHIKDTVSQKFGVVLEPEIIFWGF